jgi:hypothetical protein
VHPAASDTLRGTHDQEQHGNASGVHLLKLGDLRFVEYLEGMANCQPTTASDSTNVTTSSIPFEPADG